MAAEPAAASSYRAVATRSGDWWAITIPQLPGAFSQCKRLDQVEAMAREVIALMLDTDPADVDGVEVDVQLPDQLADDLAALRRSERLADDARQAATHAQQRAAEQLRATGLSVRDIVQLLGVSHQRVSQILARKSA
jgi:predicted RNase H-like HicB family nuclease